MSGRRLLDAARLLGAAGAVAKSHYAIRSQQWELYTKTSTLARAVKNQTDRVTVTAGAAYALARRFSGPDRPFTVTRDASPTTAEVRTEGHREDAIPKQETAQAPGSVRGGEEGLQQDHHYTRDERNATIDPPPQGEIGVVQKKAARYPTADGTIPPEGAQLGQAPSSQGRDTFAERPQSAPTQDPLGENVSSQQEVVPQEAADSTIPSPLDAAKTIQRLSEQQIPSTSATAESVPSSSLETNGQDTFNTRSEDVSLSLSSLPRVKIPKEAESSQSSDEHVSDSQINADTFSARGQTKFQSLPVQEAVPEQDQVTEGINTDVFHSPNVATMMRSGGKDDRRKAYEMRMRAAGRTRNQQTSMDSDLNQDTFSARTDTTAAPELSSHIGSGIAEGKHDEEETRKFAQSLTEDALRAEPTLVEPSSEASNQAPAEPYKMRESAVPSSRFGRFWQYSGLATSMAFGAVNESFRRITGGGATGSLMLSEANMERLVAKLSRMRGAALKLGQMMSFQDSKLLPPAINAVLSRVQDSADYMPASQRDRVLTSSLGPNWRDLFSSFSDVPMAAASIGQVHKATLASDGREVAVKVQYPGVRNSIDSDLSNLSLLLTASRLLPKGLYLDKTIANARTELGWECDYTREAECGTRFAELVSDETSIFTVPQIIDSASGPEVLTAELMHGTAVTKIPNLTQDQRDWIGTQILRLSFRELTEWSFMQTDPNWTNFLYNASSPIDGKPRLELLDFGASREFPDKFTTPYINLLIAASRSDRESCRDLSIELGYLTGSESQAMLDAHVDSILTLAEPFMENSQYLHEDGYYDFRDQTITDRVRSKIGLMVKERLAPPPEETYSLHRKLSGAFLLCARLGSRVRTREMFANAVEKWRARRQ